MDSVILRLALIATTAAVFGYAHATMRVRAAETSRMWRFAHLTASLGSMAFQCIVIAAAWPTP